MRAMKRDRFWINGTKNFDEAWAAILDRAAKQKPWSWREIADASGIKQRAMLSLLSRLQDARMIELVRPHDSTRSLPALYRLNATGLAITDPRTQIREAIEAEAKAKPANTGVVL